MWSAILSDPGGESMLMTFAMLCFTFWSSLLHMRLLGAWSREPRRTSHGLLLCFGARLLSKVNSVDALTPFLSLTESAATGQLYICKGGHHVCIGEQTRSVLLAWTCSLTPAQNLPSRLVIKLDWMVTLLLRSELCWGTVGATLLTLIVWRVLTSSFNTSSENILFWWKYSIDAH